MVAGQINFYMPFIGFFNSETGDPISIHRIFSNNETYSSNGFTTRILEMDSDGGLISGAFFGTSPYSVYKLRPSSGQIEWQT